MAYTFMGGPRGGPRSETGLDPEVRMNVDWTDLELAFRDATGIENYLDTLTGDIVTVVEGFADESMVREQLELEPMRFLIIEPVDVAFARQVMGNFVERLPPSPVQRKLKEALGGAGAFTRCMALLKEEDGALLRYYRFEQSEFWRHVESFIQGQGVVPQTPPPTVDLFEGISLA